MKDLENLTLDPSDVSDFYSKITAAVEKIAECKRQAKTLMRVKDIKGEPTNYVLFPIEGTRVEASFIDACETVVPVDDSWTKIKIELSCRLAIGLSICQETLDDSSIDVWKEGITNRGISLAISEDAYLFNVMTRTSGMFDEDGVPTSCEPVAETEQFAGAGAHGEYTLANDNVKEIISVTVTGSPKTVETVDYCAGVVKVVEDLTGQTVIITYLYSAIAGAITPATVGVLSYEDIIDAVCCVKDNCEEPDVAVVNRRGYCQLLKDDMFLDASKYPAGRDVIAKGEVGMIGGLRIVVSYNMPESMAVIMDSKRYAMRLTKGDVYSKKETVANKDTEELYFYYRIGAKVLHPGAACKICNLASDAYDSTA